MKRSKGMRIRVEYKPFSEKTLAEKINEARDTIARIESQLDLNRRGNTSHEISKSLWGAHRRWNETLTKLLADPAIHNENMGDIIR